MSKKHDRAYARTPQDLERKYSSKKADDFVVKQGELGAWRYRRWNSGIVECWITVAVSTAITTTMGSLYCGDTFSEATTYPVAFVSRPREIATIHSDGAVGCLYVHSINTKSETGRYSIIQPTILSTPTTVYYDLYVLGETYSGAD